MNPDPEQMAVHHAGHAVVQTLVAKGRYRVERICLSETEEHLPDFSWREDETRLDKEILLNLYEFGLVTLGGVAAELRHFRDHPPEQEPLVALSDLAHWHAAAKDVLVQEARIELVQLNLMRRLKHWFDQEKIWCVCRGIADALLDQGSLEGEELNCLLAPLDSP